MNLFSLHSAVRIVCQKNDIFEVFSRTILARSSKERCKCWCMFSLIQRLNSHTAFGGSMHTFMVMHVGQHCKDCDHVVRQGDQASDSVTTKCRNLCYKRLGPWL